MGYGMFRPSIRPTKHPTCSDRRMRRGLKIPWDWFIAPRRFAPVAHAYMGVSKNRGKHRKMDGEHNGKTLLTWMIWRNPIFGNIHIDFIICRLRCLTTYCMAIGPTYEWFLTFVLIKNDASLPCMVCLPIFAINVNINHSWICKGLQTSNGTDHGIYKLTETLKPQIGILNFSSHSDSYFLFILQSKKIPTDPWNIPQVPQSTNMEGFPS